MLPKEARKIVGGLSKPSKMPCPSYSLPAKSCITGSKLRAVPGSTCSKCYAFKGNYAFPRIQSVLEKRKASLLKENWVPAMVSLISDLRFFRWHDSGDLQSVEHLAKIAEVCYQTPKTKHWLPTREISILSEFKERFGSFPHNLIIRLSAMKIDGPAPTSLAKALGVQTSTVSTVNYNCPAPQQNNECGPCRKCWDKKFKNIAYKKH